MTRFLNGPVLNLLLVAGIGLPIYYAATLTERGRTQGLLRPSRATSLAPIPRSVNVATLTERGVGDVRTDTTPSVHGDRLTRDVGRPPLTPRSVNVAYRRHSYPVDFRHRWILEKAHRLRTNTKLKAEHAYAQRLLRELRHARTTQAHIGTDWRAKQIAAAEVLGREADAAGTDPWPNCADPYDHTGASWDDTVACENSGSWSDSPGFYRCGLQLDPRWEQRFGRMCP